MNKIYNYRNTQNINCVVKNCPLGFDYENYPHIAKKRIEFKMNPLKGSRWMLYKQQDTGNYHLNVDFKNQKLKFSTNGYQKSNEYDYRRFKWYYDVVNEVIGIQRHFEDYFHSSGEMTPMGKRRLIPIDIVMLDFTVYIKELTSMEIISKWWKSHIYIKLTFNRLLRHGVNHITLKFHKSDSEDAKFVVDEINTIRRIIQSKEQEKLLERWEEEHDEQEVG